MAHQLLNGRPTSRGLRRQFSLDQGSNYYVTPVSSKSVICKMPSDEFVGEHLVTITPAHVSEKPSSCSTDSQLHQAKSLDSATPSTSGGGTDVDNNEQTATNSNNKICRLSPRSIKPFIKSSSLPVVDESIEQTEHK